MVLSKFMKYYSHHNSLVLETCSTWGRKNMLKRWFCFPITTLYRISSYQNLPRVGPTVPVDKAVMLWKVLFLFLVSEQLHAGIWGWAQKLATQYSDSGRSTLCWQEGLHRHFHSLHTYHLESYRELLFTPPVSRTRRTSMWSAPPHQSPIPTNPRKACRKLANILAFHSCCQVPLLFCTS